MGQVAGARASLDGLSGEAPCHMVPGRPEGAENKPGSGSHGIPRTRLSAPVTYVVFALLSLQKPCGSRSRAHMVRKHKTNSEKQKPTLRSLRPPAFSAAAAPSAPVQTLVQVGKGRSLLRLLRWPRGQPSPGGRCG